MSPQPLLSAILIVFSSAAILLETTYRNNSLVEAALCRFHICDTGHLVRQARIAARDPGVASAQRAFVDFRTALLRDIAYPYRWCDLGEASLLAGRIEEARYCFSRAVELAPNSPSILLQAAEFHFTTHHPDDALPYTSRILKLIPNYDSEIFRYYAQAGLPPEDVLRRGIPEDSRPARSYFEYLLANSTPESAGKVWEWMLPRAFLDNRMAGRYLQFLLNKRRFKEAVQRWVSYLGPRRGEYPDSNLLFNGGFDKEPSGVPFDWTLGATEHVQEQRDSGALRIMFDGAANLDYQGVSQLAVVEPGTYQFKAAVRTEGLTTNQGIAFRLFDPESPSRLDVRTEAFGGTRQWLSVEKRFTVKTGTNLVKVQLFRQPSEKFDNKIAGMAWIKSLKLQ
jgi:hypothetical protein